MKRSISEALLGIAIADLKKATNPSEELGILTIYMVISKVPEVHTFTNVCVCACIYIRYYIICSQMCVHIMYYLSVCLSMATSTLQV